MRKLEERGGGRERGGERETAECRQGLMLCVQVSICRCEHAHEAVQSYKTTANSVPCECSWQSGRHQNHLQTMEGAEKNK